MATYTNISLAEMQEALNASKGWKQTVQNKEVVFFWPVKAAEFIHIKVYTGITTDSGQSRECGKDAIRVCAVNTRTNGGWIKAKRVHRVTGWKNNLKNRVLKVIEQSRARVRENINRNNPARPQYPALNVNGAPAAPAVPTAPKPFNINNLSRDEMAAEREVLRLEQQMS